MTRRVAVVGLGVVAPCGIGRDAFWAGLHVEAEPGAREVENFDPLPHFANPKEARRVQTAILGMHKIQERPMAVNGQVVILPMMYLALSYDHRMIDGKEAVQFLVTLKDLLEDPARMLLDV
jgi:hypothetical protein